MLLRNAIVSLERHRLGAAFRSLQPLETTTVAQAPKTPLALAAPLQTSAIIDWLATASEIARVACAAALAPELEALRVKAQAHGYADGVTAATSEFESRQAATLSRLGSIASQLEVANSRAIDELTHSCAAIVLEAFVKLAGKALVTDAAAVGAVREVLDRVCRSRRYTVFVHPADLHALEAARTELEAAIAGVTLQLQGEATLQHGGCRIESEFGLVDASFETQLRALFATLQSAHEQPEID